MPSIDPIPGLVGFSRNADGAVLCEDLPLASLARRFGTPLYVYSQSALQARAQDWLDGVAGTPHQVHYAVKANSNLAVIALFARMGLGFDIVSGGELARVIAAGGDPTRCVYSGVGKTEAELEAAIGAGVRCINIESEAEIDRIEAIGARLGRVVPVAFRVNPDVDAKTHPYISTGLRNNKFGIAFERVGVAHAKAAACPHLRVTGLDCHIGSQIVEIEPFVHAVDRVLDLAGELKARGFVFEHIDLGGGLGVRYNDETPPKAADLVKAVSDRACERGWGGTPIYFEPGRNLVATAGVLLMTVQFQKPGASKNFLVVDAAMNDMIRPTLYQADMPIVATEPGKEPSRAWEVVGPVCESGDWLGHDRVLAANQGDVLAMTGAGAYGMSMASTYNSRPRAAEVMVSGSTAWVIRERERLEDLWRGESVPPM